MLIPLGIVAASGGGAAGSFESIATTTLSTATSSITMSSIPSTYKHLQFRVLMRNTGGFACDLNLRLNSDTGSNYAYHYLSGNGASVSASGGASSDRIYNEGGVVAGASNIWSVFIIDIHDYASTTKTKTVRVFAGYDGNGFGRCVLASGLWNSTSAMNSLTLFNNVSYNWDAGTTVALYGIKGA